MPGCRTCGSRSAVWGSTSCTPGRSPRPGPVLPLILSHGWPNSFWRYTKVIPLLTDPAAHGGDPTDAFDVVVPDMPGFGYSDRPAGAPLDSVAVAALWAELMEVLGYRRFGAAGGDIGSHVSRYLALDHPDRVLAVHRTHAGIPLYTGDPADLAPEERAWIQAATTGGAARAPRCTAPSPTAAVGLTDSPAGLAAWIVEKLRAWSDCDGDVERAFTRDEILTSVTLYWFTATIGPSMRMYRANAAIPPSQLTRRVEVPSGFSLFPGDLLRPLTPGCTAPPTRSGSPSRRAAGTSPPSRNPNCTPRNSATSSAPSAPSSTDDPDSSGHDIPRRTQRRAAGRSEDRAGCLDCEADLAGATSAQGDLDLLPARLALPQSGPTSPVCRSASRRRRGRRRGVGLRARDGSNGTV